MKKVLIALITVMSALPVVAQDKLNFEAPLFGVTKKNVKPKWSVVAFGEVSGGYSYRFNLPSQIHPSGAFADLNMIEWRYRPGRNANLLSLGLSVSLDAHQATKTTFFGMDGQFTTITPGWLAARAIAAERVISLNFGYTREFGDWKTSVFLSPGVGHGILQNRYRAGVPVVDSKTGETVLSSTITGLVGSYRHRDNMYMGNGVRLGVSAGIWYRAVGLTVGWHCRSIWPGNQNVIHAGISIRY